MECELITQSTSLLRCRRADSLKPRRSKFRPVAILFTGSSRSASRAFLELNSVVTPVPSSDVPREEKLLKRYSLVLKKCTSRGRLNDGKVVHGRMIRRGLVPDSVLWTSLINFYAKCGDLASARNVLDEMPDRDVDVFSWTALISGFVGEGCGSEGVRLYCEMSKEGVRPNEISMATALKGCSMCLDAEFGKQVHAEAIKAGLLTNLLVGNSLIHVYASCGQMDLAGKVFAGMPVRDVVSWSALNSGFIGEECGSQSVGLYCEMRKAGVRPNDTSVAVTLKGCAMCSDMQFAKQVHSEAIKIGMSSDLFVANSLIAMYAKCGELRLGSKVFSGLPVRDSVSWSALIMGFVRLSCGREGVVLYSKMRKWNEMPDENSVSAVLKGLLICLDVESAKQVHAEAIKVGLSSNSSVRNYLNVIYSKCGELDAGKP